MPRAGAFPRAFASRSRTSEQARLASAAPSIQPLAGLENEGLDLVATDSEHARDLLVRLVAEFEQHKRGALIGGQPLNVLDDLAQLLSAREQARGTIDRGTVSAHPVAVRNLAAGAQLRQAAVARDRVQPRPQRTVAPTAAKRLVCRHERQLQRVLAPLAASQHVHTEAEQRSDRTGRKSPRRPDRPRTRPAPQAAGHLSRECPAVRVGESRGTLRPRETVYARLAQLNAHGQWTDRRPGMRPITPGVVRSRVPQRQEHGHRSPPDRSPGRCLRADAAPSYI